MNRIIIEEEKLEHNIHTIQEKVKNVDEKVTIIAVLKGNAYGMDAVLVAQKLLDNNIDFFAVSETQEAKTLREHGFQNPILLLESTAILEEVEEIVDYDLIATVGSLESLAVLNQMAIQKEKVIQAHLKLDTGFGRYGFVLNAENVLPLKEALAKATNVKITGTYSHFRESYSPKRKVTEKQFKQFMDDVALLKGNGIETGILHICNSAAFFKYPYMYLDAVRIGSAFTGRVQITENTHLQKVGYLESEITEIKTLPKGSKIGYSGTYTAKKDLQVAIVGAGYEAGVGVSGPKDAVRLLDKLRAVKNALMKIGKDGRMFVTINEKECPVLGRIGMKNMMVDVTDSEAKVGDKVKISLPIALANSNIKRQEIANGRKK